MKLGFSGNVLGRSGLRSHDSRRWWNQPHLSVSLAYLRDTFLYLQSQEISMYRMASELAPYLTAPDKPQFHHQIEESQAELAAVGALARQMGLRLSFHAPAHALLTTPDASRKQQSQALLLGLSQILDAMGLGPEAVIVLHVGGHYQHASGAREAWVRAFLRLPAGVQQRLALEHDDRRFSVQDILWIHQRTGVRLIFDFLHHQLYNPAGLPTPEALAMCLASWPPGQRPKIHFSSPATEMVQDARGRPHPPRLNRHSHYIHPFEFINFLRALPPMRPFDIMLEAKARDLALLQLRQHLARYAPDLISRFEIA